MADRERLCSFLSIPESRIPVNVESIANPKETLVHLARFSKKRLFGKIWFLASGVGDLLVVAIPPS